MRSARFISMIVLAGGAAPPAPGGGETLPRASLPVAGGE